MGAVCGNPQLSAVLDAHRPTQKSCLRVCAAWPLVVITVFGKHRADLTLPISLKLVKD